MMPLFLGALLYGLGVLSGAVLWDRKRRYLPPIPHIAPRRGTADEDDSIDIKPDSRIFI